MDRSFQQRVGPDAQTLLHGIQERFQDAAGRQHLHRGQDPATQ